jgi:TonB-dependent SusC/RagA subfamily outer membrane receptor
MLKPMLVLVAAVAITSAAQAQDPICVIDGARHPITDCGLVQKGGTLRPENIDRVDVLKGQAAAALYGRDAANGVISISTKQSAGPKPPADDPLARFFFPPELVMANQQAIDLSDRQRNDIVDVIKEAQGKFIDVQFRMTAEMERLQRLLQSSSVDESRVLDQLDRVLSLEREVKRTQLGLMIRIKNELTEQQQSVLRRLREETGKER